MLGYQMLDANAGSFAVGPIWVPIGGPDWPFRLGGRDLAANPAA
jgi:hypothetical protein